MAPLAAAGGGGMDDGGVDIEGGFQNQSSDYHCFRSY